MGSWGHSGKPKTQLRPCVTQAGPKLYTMYTTTELYTMYTTIQSQLNTESTIQNQLNSESTIANGVAKEDPHILAIEEPTILAKRTRNFSNRRAGVALRAQRDKGLITPWG